MVGYSAALNATGAQRTGTLTIAGQKFALTQAADMPMMTLDRTALRYGAVTDGLAFLSQTAPQSIRLSQSGTAAITWAVSSSNPWISVTPASGTGPATLIVSVRPAAGLPTFGEVRGEVVIALVGAASRVGPVSVTLHLSGTAKAPTGAFDTPADQSTGVTGSVAVTGWAIDDVAVSAVRIMREPVTGESAGQLVFIGNATLVEGARPDIAGAFADAPQNTRAGWGYLLLTNFLPNGGNGTYTLHAIADDADGHSTDLGTKTITCTNATATKPFGAIDTPGQGETVSGMVSNFGWVLSRGAARADANGGGVIRVFVDGANIGAPSGWVARSDLTGLFPKADYAGVDNALGLFGLDTTTLTNGLHTIAWIVTDNHGRTEGVGSRFFTVSNGSALRAAARPIEPTAEEISALPADDGAITGRTGFGEERAFLPLVAHDRRPELRTDVLGRLQLRLSAEKDARYVGYVHAGAALWPLPAGSRLEDGTFTWQPGVGFVGDYDLVFVRIVAGQLVARQDVRIVLAAKAARGTEVVIDAPFAGEDVDSSFIIGGWAADLDATAGTGVDAVHIWAYPATGDKPVFLGAATFGDRPDVGAQFGDRFRNSGYGLAVQGLAPGTYMLAVFARSIDAGDFLPAKTVSITVR